ncbi:MAG: PAS domain-containing protein [Candidatus Accumulibacter sp. UW20]|jgi:PAS domain S-box-containing protein
MTGGKQNALVGGSISATAMRRTRPDLRAIQIDLARQSEARRQGQTEADATRVRYLDGYHLAPVGHCTLSENGLILDANLTTGALLGVSREKLIEQPICRFVFGEDEEIHQLYLRTIFETLALQACELRLVKADGTVFRSRLEATAVQERSGVSLRLIALGEVCERRPTEAGWPASGESLQAITDDAIAWQAWFDPDGKCRWVNPAVERVSGYSVEELLAIPDFLFALIAEEDRPIFLMWLQGAVHGGHEDKIAFRSLHKNGAKGWCRLSWQPAYDAQGKLLGMRVSGRDLSERKQAERQAARS